jgi:peptidoglycan/LPS O-acetylase OafA/YrhL/lysophospholipase L1-like esterase
VLAVLLFHLQLPWARGGFLGVSAFFTLSGYLICSLLLDEHARTGRIALGAFWSRRARRLLPAALVALFAVTAVVAAGWAAGPSTLGPDVVAAVAYVANWRFVASSQSYGALFAAPSPVLHFWSLAIEEQFYVVFPLVVAGALWLGRRALGAVLGVLAAGSVVAGVLLASAAARAYYGNDVRAVELLVGALLALALSTSLADGLRRVSRRLAPIALGGLLVAWAVTPQGWTGLFRGGLVLHALAVAVLIAATAPGGVVARLLSAAPLRGLGRISYGVYLFHWPLFVWLTPIRTGLDGVSLTGVRLGATLAVALASFVLVEEPIRSGRRLRPSTARVGAIAGATAVLAGALLVLPVPSPVATSPTASFAAAPKAAAVAPSSPVAYVSDPTTSPTAPPVPRRVYVAGDSVALRLGQQLDAWSKRARGLEVWTSGWLACPAARGGTYRYAGIAKRVDAKCNDRDRVRADELDGIHPDVVVASYGVFDVLDRRRPGSSRWEHLGEPTYDDYVRSELVDLQTLFASRGARVVWLTTPYVKTGGDETGFRPARPFPEWDHARMDRYNALVREVAATSPVASVVDLEDHERAAWGDEEDPAHRPDGIHPSIDAADELAGWLGPQLIAR